MESAPPATVWGIITDFLADDPTSQEIIDFRFPPEIETRLHHLLDLNGEDEISPKEHKELFDLVRANSMMSLLAAKKRLKQRKNDL